MAALVVTMPMEGSVLPSGAQVIAHMTADRADFGNTIGVVLAPLRI
jgi:hypothetical protein